MMTEMIETIKECVKSKNTLIVSDSIDYLFNFHEILDSIKTGAIYDSRLFSSDRVRLYVREDDYSKYSSNNNIYSLDKLMEITDATVVCDLELAESIHHNFEYVLYVGKDVSEIGVLHSGEISRDILTISDSENAVIGVLFRSIPDDLIDVYKSIMSGPDSNASRQDVVNYIKAFRMSKIEIPSIYLIALKSTTLTEMTSIIGYCYSILGDTQNYGIIAFTSVSLALVRLGNDLAVAMLEMVVNNNDEFSNIAKAALSRIAR